MVASLWRRNADGALYKHGQLQEVDELPPEVQAVVAGVKVIRTNLVSGDQQREWLHEVRLVDKMRALELLAKHAQRFLSVHGLVLNLFRVGRHLLRAVNHRTLRIRAFGVWMR